LNDLMIATDSEEVRRYCADNAIPVIMTGRHASGSDRLYEVMRRTDGDVYVNIQGDEPTLRPVHLEQLLLPVLKGEAAVTTLKVAIDRTAAMQPDIVKVVTDANGYALYFSRHPIPFDRGASGGIRYYKHIGLYAYTRSVLEQFYRLPQSPLELAEKLEQLRFLSNGIPILVAETPHDTIGVDTEDDLQRASAWLASESSSS
jgi:3-deoxy-manno-octulosonate cytidylyltransferase (CMP-KDO synthetase)